MVELDVAGEKVRLDGRALVWPGERTLVIADTHFGKDAAARAVGAAVPEGTTVADLARLDGLVARHAVARLWILGDVFHSEFSKEARTMAVLEAWRERWSGLEVEIVLGNHDRRVDRLTERLGMRVLPGWRETRPLAAGARADGGGWRLRALRARASGGAGEGCGSSGDDVAVPPDRGAADDPGGVWRDDGCGGAATWGWGTDVCGGGRRGAGIAWQDGSKP